MLFHALPVDVVLRSIGPLASVSSRGTGLATRSPPSLAGPHSSVIVHRCGKSVPLLFRAPKPLSSAYATDWEGTRTRLLFKLLPPRKEARDAPSFPLCERYDRLWDSRVLRNVSFLRNNLLLDCCAIQ